MPVRIAVEDPDQREVIALLEDGEAYGASLYPAESNHFFDVEALRAANVVFVVARDDYDAAIGTAALVLHGDWAELKRMWVVPGARGKGISKIILDDLEAKARQEGVRTLRLETGVRNKESLGLYTRIGFRRCDPFADYKPDPLSVFMEKELV